MYGWKHYVAVLGGSSAIIALVLYPIFIYPSMNLDEYSALNMTGSRVREINDRYNSDVVRIEKEQCRKAVDENKIRSIIKSLKNQKSAGMYGISTYVLKHCWELVVIPLKKIQAYNRRSINQEDIQPGGMRVWSDPFGRK